MKNLTLVAVAVLLLATICTCSSQDTEPLERGDRHARVVCDLLGWFAGKEAVCAARCIAMNKGYRGGYCEKGVCHCRK